MSESTPTNLNTFLNIVKAISEKTNNPIPSHLEILIGDNNLQKPENLEEAVNRYYQAVGGTSGRQSQFSSGGPSGSNANARQSSANSLSSSGSENSEHKKAKKEKREKDRKVKELQECKKKISDCLKRI